MGAAMGAVMGAVMGVVQLTRPGEGGGEAAFLETTALSRLSSTEASLLYSTEPVWAAVFGCLVLGERLTPAAVAGGALIVAACLTRLLQPSQPADREGGHDGGGAPKLAEEKAAGAESVPEQARVALRLAAGSRGDERLTRKGGCKSPTFSQLIDSRSVGDSVAVAAAALWAREGRHSGGGGGGETRSIGDPVVAAAAASVVVGVTAAAELPAAADAAAAAADAAAAAAGLF